MEVALLLVFVALLAFGAGAFLFRRDVLVVSTVVQEVEVTREVEVPVASGRLRAPKVFTLQPNDGHDHRYTFVDSAGWHCSYCDAIKPDEAVA